MTSWFDGSVSELDILRVAKAYIKELAVGTIEQREWVAIYTELSVQKKNYNPKMY